MPYNVISNSILAIIFIIVQYIIYKINIKTLDEYPHRYFYLSLKTNNKIVQYEKSKTKERLKASLFLFSFLILMQINNSILIGSILIFIFLLAYLIGNFYLINKSVKNLKANNLTKKDETDLVKFGGLYYYNKDDSRDFIDNTTTSVILNFARPFAKLMILITVLVAVAVIVVFAMI